MAKPWPSKVYPQAKVYRAGPWLGMRDSQEPAAADPAYAKLLLNCYAAATETGARCVTGIPGFSLAGTQLGSVGARAIQWIGQFTKTTGTTKSLVICNGEIVEYDWGGNTMTTRISAANLAASSITLATTGRVHCCMFFDTLVVSDGTNTPFTWDGTAGAGLVKLTSAPPFYGQPVVYYAKLFGIKATEPDTIVWSEEGTPNVGYEAGGYTNAWTLPGTKGERLNALAASNATLGILRPRSTTDIFGRVLTDFQTAGTLSSVSERVGAGSPSTTVVLDEGTITTDAHGQPQFWARGVGYAQAPALWNACENTIARIPSTAIGFMQTALDDASNLIWVGFGTGTQMTDYLLFERTGGVPNFVGTATGFPSQRLGQWSDASGVPRFVHGGVDDGYVYYHGHQHGDQWNFEFAAGTTAVPHEIRPAEMGADIAEEKNFDEFEIEVLLPTNLDVTLGYFTPNGLSTTVQSVAFTGAGGAFWDIAEWDVDDWVADGSENTRERVGIAEYGRWLVPSIRHNALDQQFCIINCQATAFGSNRYAEVV